MPEALVRRFQRAPSHTRWMSKAIVSKALKKTNALDIVVVKEYLKFIRMDIGVTTISSV